jgi:hypothetical protein
MSNKDNSTHKAQMKDAIAEFKQAENLFNNAPLELIDYATYIYDAACEKLNVVRRTAGGE